MKNLPVFRLSTLPETILHQGPVEDTRRGMFFCSLFLDVWKEVSVS